jgi:hypothetical protein
MLGTILPGTTFWFFQTSLKNPQLFFIFSKGGALGKSYPKLHLRCQAGKKNSFDITLIIYLIPLNQPLGHILQHITRYIKERSHIFGLISSVSFNKIFVFFFLVWNEVRRRFREKRRVELISIMKSNEVKVDACLIKKGVNELDGENEA